MMRKKGWLSQLSQVASKVKFIQRYKLQHLNTIFDTTRMIKGILIVTGCLLLSTINKSHTAEIGKYAKIRKLFIISFASLANISESAVNKHRVQLNRCISGRGGFLSRKAYLDSLYACSNKKSFLR